MKPHKHAELIKAWADGAEIQARYSPGGEWFDVVDPSWHESSDYRIKPQKKKIRYRLALMKGPGGYFVDVQHGYPLERSSCFIEWRGDWQEVEVEE